jgi:hypothetical protein
MCHGAGPQPFYTAGARSFIGMTMIDRLTVISLDRTPQRYAQFRAWNPGLKLERFSAVDGKFQVRAHCVRDGLITEDNQYTAGAIGSMMSHTALWRRCAAGNVALHIAEDDVILRADFLETASGLLERLGDYDIVLWMHNFDWPLKAIPSPGVGPAVIQYNPEHFAGNFEVFRAETVPPVLLRLASAAAIGCYSITPRGARRMLADCLPVGAEQAEYVVRPGVKWHNFALDVEMCRHYPNWQAYVSFPPIAAAPNDQSASTIRGHLAQMHDPAIANRVEG